MKKKKNSLLVNNLVNSIENCFFFLWSVPLVKKSVMCGCLNSFGTALNAFFKQKGRSFWSSGRILNERTSSKTWEQNPVRFKPKFEIRWTRRNIGHSVKGSATKPICNKTFPKSVQILCQLCCEFHIKWNNSVWFARGFYMPYKISRENFSSDT